MGDDNQKAEVVVLKPESVVVDADINPAPAPAAASETPQEPREPMKNEGGVVNTEGRAGCMNSKPEGPARLEDVVYLNERRTQELSKALEQLAKDASEQLTEMRLRIRLLEDVVCDLLGLSRVDLLTRAGELHLDRVTKAFLGKSDNFPEIEFSPSTTLTGHDILTESV